MDPEYRPITHRRPALVRTRRTHPVFSALMSAVAALAGFAAFTGAANAPVYSERTMPPVVATASLGMVGTDAIITGSVDVFAGGAFVGPNRAEKRDRARPAIDAIAFARSFDAMQVRLASLRDATLITDGPLSRPGELAAIPPVEDTPKISIASIGPLAESAALSAIDSVAPVPEGPVPLIQSKKIAYARANTPVTDFSVVRDDKGKVVSKKDLWCLASAIYFESRGEKYRGQIAVAQVVMNRLHHPIYPKTICGVVFQNQNKRNACQFSFACDGIPERVTDAGAWKQAEEIALGVVQGVLYVPEVGKATHYHATYVYPHWAPRMKKVTKIGLHAFYQFKSGWRFG